MARRQAFFVGYLLAVYFEKIHIRDTAKVMILLSVSFLLVTAEDRFGEVIPFSGLLAVMGVGIALKESAQLLPCACHRNLISCG